MSGRPGRVVIIGGCGHVGLPLGVKLALAGLSVHLVDRDAEAVACVNRGRFPFLEHGGDAQLREALAAGLVATSKPEEIAEQSASAEVAIFVTGTPLDERLNPKLSAVVGIFDEYAGHFAEGTLVVMRSTLSPGTMEHLRERARRTHPSLRWAFCPERVAQGHALEEIESLPQIVAAFDDESFAAAAALFARVAPSIIRLTPLEAELTKLMANSWRYLEFAIANQFYLLAEYGGVDFHRLYEALRYEYPRAAGYKRAGFAAGPCLFKDTLQLASFFDNDFPLGQAAMLVNEGLAAHVVEKVSASLGQRDLWGRTVGVLGMAFKADSDDIRESLSFKVKKLLEFRGARVLCADPYLPDADPLDRVLAESEALVLATPHAEYRSLQTRLPVVDVWGLLAEPELEILPGAGSRDG